MTCRDVIEIIARAEAGLLDPGESAAFDQHLTECPRCRAERVLAARLTAALRADPGPAPASDFTARVLDRVRSVQVAESPQRWWTPIIPAMALVLSILAIRPVLPALPLPGIGEGLRSLLLPALGWMENGLATLGLGTSPVGLGAIPPYTLPAVVFTACVSGILVWVARETYTYRGQ